MGSTRSTKDEYIGRAFVEGEKHEVAGTAGRSRRCAARRFGFGTDNSRWRRDPGDGTGGLEQPGAYRGAPAHQRVAARHQVDAGVLEAAWSLARLRGLHETRP